MNALWQIARSLAFDSHAAGLWRRIALVGTTLVTLTTLTLGFSIINSLDANEGRSQARAVAGIEVDPTSVEPDASGLWLLRGLDSFEERQFIVNQIEPNRQDVFPLPRGMDEIPAPGVAVVSPALGHLIDNDNSLAARYPNYQVLDWNGVSTVDELYAWVRPLDRELFLEGEGLVFVREFNYQSVTPSPFGSTLDNPIPRRQIYLFASVVGVLPAMLLTLVGISAHSSKRENRIKILQNVGVNDWWIIKLSMLESVLVTLPLALLTLPLLKLALQRVDTLPFFGLKVVRGDLDVSWMQLVLTLLVVILLSLISLTIQVKLVRKYAIPIRTLGIVRMVSQVGMLGLAAYLTLVLAPQSTAKAMTLFVANLLIIFTVIPSVLVQLVGAIGHALARSKRLVVQIGGARLQYLTMSRVRPFVGIALVLILLLQGTGMVAHLYDRLEFVDTTRIPSSAEVRASVPFDTLKQSLEERLDDVLVFPAFYVDGDPDSIPPLVLAVDCNELARYFGIDASSCGTDSEIESGMFGFVFHHPHIKFDPDFADQMEVAPDSLMVVSNRSTYQMDQDVRTALPLAEFPGLSITTPESYRLKVTPVVPWIEQGVTFAVGLIGIVVLVGIIDQSISGGGYSRKLISLGASITTLRWIEAVTFLIPSLAAFGLGLGLGILELSILDRLISFPWSMIPLGQVTASGIVLIYIATVFVVVLNTRVRQAEER